jgi:hypothetical protein
LSRRAALAALVLLVAAAGAAWWFWPRDETKPILAAPTRPGLLVYETSGFESVDAFGGSRHTYPARTNVAVLRTDPGCTIFRWRPLEGRLYEWELCGKRLVRFTELHRFFGRDDRRTYRCDARSSLQRGWRCTAGDTTETARVVSSSARHVRLRTTLTGNSKGSGLHDLRFRADGVPLRMLVENESATPSFLGAVHYRERYELRLVAPSRG